MSKLEELINELCPDGVEYKKIDVLLKEKHIKLITPSIKLKSKDYLEEGLIPIVSQELEYISGYTNVSDNNLPEDKYVCFGDHSEHIKYIDFQFVQGADGLKIFKSCNDELNIKYIYYVFCNFYTRHNNYERHTKYLKDTEIPVPPLPVQEEIVRILDSFTELTAELTAELTVELTARKKQYEYYRATLMNFNEDVEWVPLGSIGRVSMCKRILKNQTTSEGDIPFYKIGTFGKKADAFISRQLFEEYKEKYSFPKKGTILISASGTIGRTVVYDGEPAYYQDSNIIWLEHDESKILNSYLYYCYQLNPWRIAEGGTISRLYNDSVHKTKIPVPYSKDKEKSLKAQQRIVDILDRFDTLCNDISTGLLAEIDKRQKQYEYYRDKLLTFKRLEVND